MMGRKSETEMRQQLDAGWRASEYVVSYPDWGTRGRMRGSSVAPTGTFHRSACRTLKEDARAAAYNPSSVYETTLSAFQEQADRQGLAGEYRICQHCCRDVVVTGRNMVKRPPPKSTDPTVHAVSGAPCKGKLAARALAVMVLDPRLSSVLRAHDPTALAQAETALVPFGWPDRDALARKLDVTPSSATPDEASHGV